MANENSEKFKVLLVEDEQNIARLFSLYLVKAGYNCDHAINGKEGLIMAKKIVPDIIISDIMMPEMDGFEFRKNLLTDNDLKAIPFVFLTAKGEEDDILGGYDLGIEDYIIKTASPKIVIAKISAILKSLGKEREKVVGEINKAVDNMATKVVPDEYPEVNGYFIKHWHNPFENIPGGDFLDYIRIDDTRYAVVLGDVMGKRWGAWYFAVAYAGYVRSAIRIAVQANKGNSPSSILEEVNKAVHNDERISEVFTTLSLIVVDENSKIIKYAGAGDLPVLYRSSKGEVKSVQSNGLLLGFSEESSYSDIEIELKKGEFVIMFTDGLTDSRNPEGVSFSETGIKKVLETIKETQDPVEIVKEKISSYTNNKFDDDISVITIKAL
ncbi:MAG: SpoIIE family protein phosphatase [Ignavibacteria bacterium]|nr:SpoIIE family protein phosphatase [Ignavibacteria bacterium]